MSTYYVNNKYGWLHMNELFEAMGWAVSKAAIEASGGTRNQFSSGSGAPETRSHFSTSKQIGNSVHINSLGAINILDLLTLPVECFGSPMGAQSDSDKLKSAFAKARSNKRSRVLAREHSGGSASSRV